MDEPIPSAPTRRSKSSVLPSENVTWTLPSGLASSPVVSWVKLSTWQPNTYFTPSRSFVASYSTCTRSPRMISYSLVAPWRPLPLLFAGKYALLLPCSLMIRRPGSGAENRPHGRLDSHLFHDDNALVAQINLLTRRAQDRAAFHNGDIAANAG